MELLCDMRGCVGLTGGAEAIRDFFFLINCGFRGFDIAAKLHELAAHTLRIGVAIQASPFADVVPSENVP